MEQKSVRKLEQELSGAYGYFYSYPSILARARALSPRLFVAWLLTNLGFRRFRIRKTESAGSSWFRDSLAPKWSRFARND